MKRYRTGVVVLSAALAFGYSVVTRAHPEDRRDEEDGRTITYSGYLEDGGRPASAMVDVGFRIFAEPSGGVALWEGSTRVTPQAGRFVVELGGRGMPSLPDSVFRASEAFVEVTVNGVTLMTRQRLGTARHATFATAAADADRAETAALAEVARSADAFVVRDGLDVSGPVQLFGDVQSTGWELGVEYTARTDGFVVAYAAGSGGSRTVWVGNRAGEAAGEGWVCRVLGSGVSYATNPCPVKRGWTWRVEGTGTGFIRWVPFGSD